MRSTRGPGALPSIRALRRSEVRGGVGCFALWRASLANHQLDDMGYSDPGCSPAECDGAVVVTLEISD